MRGIAFDLLAQTVNVRLKRVRGYVRIVTPHFAQEDVACHDTLSGTIEIAQNCRFFLRQSKLVAFVVDEML